MQASNKVLFLTEIAIFSALSLILDLFSFRLWAQGGSVSLQMFPIFLMAFRWGMKGGITTGLVVGLLQLILNPYIIHPAQALLDYPVAFTLVGLSAITANSAHKSAQRDNRRKLTVQIILGVFIGSFGRFLAHFFAAFIFFGSSAPAGQPIWLYSLIYNGSYMLPSFIINAVLIVFLLLTRINLIVQKK